jgi:protein TonB
MTTQALSAHAQSSHSEKRRPLRSLVGVVIAIGFHLIVLSGLLQLDSVRSAVIAAVPITVSLITPPTPAVRETPPKPIPPKPERRVERPKPAPIAPIITADPEVPAEIATSPLPPPAPPAPIETPALVAAAPGTERVAPAAAPAAPPLVPPNFNAAYLNNPAPAYPVLSRRMGEEGRVVLRVHVSEDGRPTQVQLRTSSSHPRLDEVALDAVRRWRFVPARRGDIPVAAWVLVPISFSLRS